MANITFSQSSEVNNSVFGKSQEPIQLFVEKKAEGWEQMSALPKIFSTTPSKNFGEKFTTLTAMSGFQPVGENGAYPADGMQEGYSKFLEHMTWKDRFSVSEEMVQDSKTMDFKKQPANFTAAYYRTREQYGAALLAGAVNGSTKVNFSGKSFDVTTADNKALFATDHPSILKKPAQSNKFADAFTADALAAVESAMQDFRGDNNEILAVTPDTIVIPNDYALKKAVFAAIGADQDPATANNGFNFLFGRWNVIVWQYLNQYLTSGLTPYILMDSKYNEEYQGAVWLEREDLTLKSYIDHNTDANVWNGRARFVAGFNDWRAFAVGGLTGGTTLIDD